MTSNKKEINWLKYGLEFLVVIIAILLAFQINTCSLDIEHRETVATHLKGINAEVLFNKQVIEESIKEVESNINKLDTIIGLLKRKKNYKKINQMSINLLTVPYAQIKTNAYQNFVKSVDIRLIKNFDTKKRIINLYESFKWLESVDEISRNVLLGDYYEYVKENFDLISNETQDESLYSSRVFKNVIVNYKVTSQNRIENHSRIKNEIEAYLNVDKES